MATEQLVERKDRIKHVRLALAAPLGRFVSQELFGSLVASEQGRSGPYDTSTVKRWEDGAEPDLAALEAIVRLAKRHHIAHVTRAWLAFGQSGVTEALSAPPLKLTDVTQQAEEADRGRRGSANKK